MRKYLITLISLLAISLLATAALAGNAADKFTAFDKNHDESISRQEWFNHMTNKEMMDMEREVDWDKGMTRDQYEDRAYKNYDYNRDDKITRDEWKMSRNRDYKSFDEADMNKDNMISKEEYSAATYSNMDLNQDASISREEWFKFMEGKQN